MAQECFIYITLPGTVEPVAAARFEITTTPAGDPLGRFVYGRSYLENPDSVPFDPVELALSSKIYETVSLKGVFGALRDSSPDHWGRRVIARHLGKAEPSELEYLLHSSDDRAGALSFGLGPKPPGPKREFNKRIDLERLQKLADALLSEENLPDNADIAQVDGLLNGGSSMGGARPKVVVEDDGALWIAKFNVPKDDKWNYARVEHAMLTLAKSAGLSVSESRVVQVGDRDVLLVKRFDREHTDAGYRRARMISGLTLLRSEDSHQDRARWSYILLAEEIRRASGEAKRDANELFRRMCLNALISNTDDHPRNHAMIAMGKPWRLSPAYDLVPAPAISLEKRDLALICGDQGRIMNTANLLSQSGRFLLEKGEAENLLQSMRDHVAHEWHAFARREGVSEADCEKIRPAFVYPGLDLDHVEPANFGG
ncbi:MAG: type II toxin-antitoxin system HipA family toxin [Alphaproteobacteria bacterium]|nr:type II toxin-antitoxin system HipA family toxin [Alphaproteobacteria bacterium]